MRFRLRASEPCNGATLALQSVSHEPLEYMRDNDTVHQTGMRHDQCSLSVGCCRHGAAPKSSINELHSVLVTSQALPLHKTTKGLSWCSRFAMQP